MAYAFDFIDGFEGTDERIKPFHVIVYRPGPPPGTLRE